MKKNTKKTLLGALVLSMALCGVVGVATVAEVKAADAIAFDDFVMDEGASVRTDNPTGIRFTTFVGANAQAALEGCTNVKYGTLVVPVSMLTQGTSSLDKTVDGVVDIPADVWVEEGAEFNGVIVGADFSDYAAANYEVELVAQSYVEYTDADGATYTYYAPNPQTRSIAYVASAALAKEEDFTEDEIEYLTGIVNAVIADENVGFAEEEISLTLRTDKIQQNVAIALDANVYVQYESNSPEVATVDSNGVVTAKGVGTAVITATVGSQTDTITVKVADRTYAYGEISDMTNATDAFYHASKNWGASQLNDLGVKYSDGDTVDYGTTTELTAEDREALVAAGYKGTKTSLTTWRATRDLTTELDGSNGFRTELYLGSANFNDALADLIDSDEDLANAYISVWMKAGAKVSFRYSQVLPFKTGGGAYSGQHMVVGLDSTISVGNGYVEANTWVEHRWPVASLVAKITSGDMKGIGFGLSVTTAEKDGAATTIPYVDIYSIEIVFPDVVEYPWANDVSVDLPALGVEGFAQSIEVYNGTTKLTEGTDYTYANGDLDVNKSGEYTIKQTVTGNGMEDTVVTRSYKLGSNTIVGSASDVKVVSGTVSASTAAGKPLTYTGFKTENTSVAVETSAIAKYTFDVSAVVAAWDRLPDTANFVFWFRIVSKTATIPAAGNRNMSIDFLNAAGSRVTSDCLWISGTFDSAYKNWVSYSLTKATIDSKIASGKSISDLTTLMVQSYCSTTAYTLYTYFVEFYPDSNVGTTFTNALSSTVTAGGWTAGCYGNIHTAVFDAQPTGYVGAKTDLLGIVGDSRSGDAQTHARVNVSAITSNLANMADDEVLSIWVKSGWLAENDGVFNGSVISKGGANMTTTAHLNNWVASADKIGEWFNLRVPKADLTADIEYFEFCLFTNLVNSRNAKVPTTIAVYSVDVIKA